MDVFEIKNGEQNRITFPKLGELDMDPQKVGTYLTWMRRNDTYKGDIWVKNGLKGKEHIWLKDVDESSTFFMPN